MFTDDQKAMLAAKLIRDNIKSRSQSGRSLSYIESWVAISEANRIFGFDGWNRETVEARCVAEKERKVGASGADGWSVSYTAKVRVTVGTVVREGCGAGHGIDRDLGLAHESALKEAESDAGKRALMTFGNPFGLALYDKAQEGVEDDRPPAPAERKEREPAPPSRSVELSPAQKKMAAIDWATKAIATVRGMDRIPDLDMWTKTNADAVSRIRDYDTGIHTKLTRAIKDRYDFLQSEAV